MLEHELYATCIFGLEAIVARELKYLGYNDQTIENGKVFFKTDINGVARANIFLRCAERVLYKIAEFEAYSFEDLFQGVKKIDWVKYLPKDARFPVDVTSINSKLFSVSDCQSIAKKAVVDKLKEAYGIEWFDESAETYKICISIFKDRVIVAMDTSGVGLHKRGYRSLVGQAPIKETLAAAMLSISWWRKDRILIDPFCGSGTIPIEAALMARNIAPGMNRHFVSESWRFIPESSWEDAKQEAFEMIDEDIEVNITGTDIDENAISISRFHAKQAGVENDIHFQCLPMNEISSRKKYGFIICNPPYGERMGDAKDAEKLYREMGKAFKAFDTWSFYVITDNMDFESFFGRRADKKRKLYNGMIKCDYYQFFGPKPPRTHKDILK